MTIKFTFDNQEVTVDEGTTILQAAAKVGADVPTICYHEATTANGLCRMCVVEVDGMRVLQPGCVVLAAEGMSVHSRSEKVVRARKTILEMLDSSVDLSDAPEIQNMMSDYQVDHQRFPDAERREIELIDDNPMYIRDYEKCVLCWRCVQVCAEDAQYTFALNFSGRGYETQIATFFDEPMPATSCVFCGQCVGVCPTGALKPKREMLLEKGHSPEQITVMSSGRKRRKNNDQA